MKNQVIYIILKATAIILGICFLSSCAEKDPSPHDFYPPTISLSDPIIQMNTIVLSCSLDLDELTGYKFNEEDGYSATSLNFIFEYGTDWDLSNPHTVEATLAEDCFFAAISHYIPGRAYYYRATVRPWNGESVISTEKSSFSAPEMANSIEIGGLTWANANIKVGGGYSENGEDWYYTWNQAMSLCPDGWSLPTEKEIDDLLKSGTSWRRSYSNATPDNKAGVWFGSNHAKAFASNPGRAFFLPACGYRNLNSGKLNLVNSYGSYWTSSSSGENACYLTFGEDVRTEYNNKAFGRSVRCIEGLSDAARLTVGVEDVRATTAMFNGEITFDGGTDITERGFVYSETNISPAIEDALYTIKETTNIGSGIGLFEKEITNLKAEATYYVRSYAINANLTYYSDVKEFTTTTSLGAPIYKDGSYSGVGVMVANMWWAPVNLGVVTPTGYGGYYQFGRKEEGWTSGWAAAYNAWNDGSENAPIKTSKDPCPSGWKIPTSEEFQTLLKTSNTNIRYYGNTHSTKLLRITCNATTNYIDFPPAGYKDHKGGVLTEVSNDGYYWSSSIKSGYGTGGYYAKYGHCLHFNSETSSLKKERNYLSNGFSVRCIQDLNVSKVPTVTTADVTNVKAATATLNGSLTDDGGALRVERGFVYSTINNPPSLNEGYNTLKTVFENDTDSYSCDITNLSFSTKYYVRAYAINSAGTSYGEVKTFTTRSRSDAPTYIDGSYVGVGIKIDGLWWAPINVYYTSLPPYGLLFNYGKSTGFKYGNTGESATDGNWKEKDQGPCPDGWYIPTAEQYENLLLATNSPSTNNIPGQWRKSYENTPGNVAGRWFGPNCRTATAYSSENAIFFPAAGYWYPDFSGKGGMGMYWSSTFEKSLYFDSRNAQMTTYSQSYGLSVRCVQD